MRTRTAFRRTLRMRLALLYGGLFFVSGAALLAIPAAFVGSQETVTAPVGQPPPPGPSLADSQHGRDVEQYVIGAVIALAVMVLLSVALGWLLSGRLLRPLRTITATAREMSAGSLDQRLALSGSDDEFQQLGQTLDDLFGRLEAAFEAQRHFVANASHELRTPLAAERTLLQVALADPDADAVTLRAACKEALTLGEQQARLVAALLTLATGEQGVERWEEFDLAEVAANVLAGRRKEAAERGIEVDAALGPAPATGDPSLVESLVANLVDNALRHNVPAPGGRLSVRTAAVGARSALTVTNSGAAVPPASVERLFQPFQRLGTARTRGSRGQGYGLGLAIVRAIAATHGATIIASARPEGGLTVEVKFPERAGAHGELTRPGRAGSAA
jgi:signal transduction histidine kinase